MFNQKTKFSKNWYRCFWVILFIIVFLTALFLFDVWGRAKNIAVNNFISNLSVDNLPATNRDLIEKKDSPSWGAENPKVVIVKFGDFECPFCGKVFPILSEIGFEYPDQVRFIYRNFLGHPNSQKPAEAAQCAYEQDKFLAYHNKLFDNQGSNTIDRMKRYARELGIKDLKKFDECLDSGKFADRVKQDFQEALELGATVTPTVFINGFKVQGALTKELYVKIIEKILKEK